MQQEKYIKWLSVDWFYFTLSVCSWPKIAIGKEFASVCFGEIVTDGYC